MKKSSLFKIFYPFILSLIIISAAIFRLFAYGDNRLSIGTIDTGVYLIGAEKPLLSWEFLISGRPFTLPLIYKMLEPAEGYNLKYISEPAILGTERDLQLQRGFDIVVLFQIILSIISWSFLAWVVSCNLRDKVIKVISPVLVLCFGFSPQVAEWDHILFSESVSFSLFALLLGLTIFIVHRLSKLTGQIRQFDVILIIFWAIIFTLWVFSRDTNVYLLVLTILFILGLMIIPGIRKRMPLKLMVIISIYFLGIFLLHQRTQHESGRWILPFQSNLVMRVFPYPDRVEYFRKLGMPVTEEILSSTDLFNGPEKMNKSDEFMEWVIQKGTGSYMRFLMEYPLWSLVSLYDSLETLFGENLQPWFTGPRQSRPLPWIIFGDIFHIKSQGVILIDLLLSMPIIIIGLKNLNERNFAWTWIVAWLFAAEFILLFVSFHGDPRSIIRHVLVAVMPYRFSVWFLSLVISDIVITSKSA